MSESKGLSIEEWKSNLKARIRAYNHLTDTELEVIAKACLDAVEGGSCPLDDAEWAELNSLGNL